MSRRKSTVELSRLTFSLPTRLHQLFDSIRKEQGYATISEAIRDLIRLYVERSLTRENKEGRELGVVAYVLPASKDERKQMLISDIIKCEAEFRDVVQSVSAVAHAGKIMRVAVVCGDVRRISEFRDAVEALKDVNVIGASGWRIEEVR
ncbi:MAG: ribbon-helix-helix protein, CopG family [Methanophagales archaeon]|nr:ribbon-helix-helix protein, CopG family [Methanophagales archaeon]